MEGGGDWSGLVGMVALSIACVTSAITQSISSSHNPISACPLPHPTHTQTKRVGAKKGYELLKKKSDALKVRFRDIMKDIARTKSNMADQVRMDLPIMHEKCLFPFLLPGPLTPSTLPHINTRPRAPSSP